LLVQQALLGEALSMSVAPTPPSPLTHEPTVSRRIAYALALVGVVVVVSLAVALRGTPRSPTPDFLNEQIIVPAHVSGSSEQQLPERHQIKHQNDPSRVDPGETEAVEHPTSGSPPRLSERHGLNSILVIEIEDFPYALSVSLEKLRHAEQIRLADWIESDATVNKMTGEDAFMLLTPEDHGILVLLFDREVIERISDRHRIFASIGQALDTERNRATWEDAQNLSDYAGLFGGIPGFTSLSNMSDTERLEHVLKSVDVPILIVHSLEHADLGKVEANNYHSGSPRGNPANFLE
jgi:hypothetical protein